MSTLKLVFLTPLAYGHANVQYAILRNLLTEPRPGIQHLHLHIIGDEPQRKRLQSLPTSSHATLTFHPMGEEDIHLKFTAAGGSVHVRGPPLSLTYKRGLSMLTGAPDVMYHKPEAYLSRYRKIVDVLEKVKPDLFVVDLLLHSLGVDAVAKTGVPHVVVSPGPSMDLACPNQPGGRGFWKYPWYESRSQPRIHSHIDR
jgi:hypothetical protein